MDLGSLFIILALLILVGLYVARPLLERRAAPVSQEEHTASALLAERDRLINALQELDFDFTLGKIPEEEYPGQRAFLLTQGAEVLRRLDELRPQTAAEDAEARLEAAIAARRADAARAAAAPNGAVRRLAPAAPDDDLEALIASRRRERKEKTGGFCPQCGRPVQKSDRFCPKCGVAIA
ncbi:MAG: zinc ribbon domain-containing protein [Chloroflexi bacterium]|nr:zinc ribbon domain-containing protein [Chloroflexota bacterium]